MTEKKLKNGLDPKIGENTQWKPGQSGNPSGKPKGARHISSYIKEMMEDDTFVQKLRDGTELQGAPIEAIIKTAIAKAISGDKDAREWLAKYGWGTKIDITSDDLPIPLLGGTAARPTRKKAKK